MNARKPACRWFAFVAIAVWVGLLNGLVAQEPVLSGGRSGQEISPPPGLRPFQHAQFLSARRGAEWLWNANRPDGTFVPGMRPDLDAEIEDDLLRQFHGAYGLARSARFFASERYGARARQAILSLLVMTRTDPQDPSVRFTVPPSSQTNRLAAAALLILAIHELPEPGADLLEPADQLTNYVLKQQQKDGSLRVWENGDETAGNASEAGMYSAYAILALARSHARRPDAAKLTAARTAFASAYRDWQGNKTPLAASLLTWAGAELHALTNDKALGENVCEMADWLVTLQHGSDPRRLAWQGGFRTAPGSARDEAVSEPTVESALCVEALAQACRVVRAGADLQRFGRYREACERGLQFLSTLQYSPANTKHYAEWYSPRLYGAFRDAPQQGTIRLEGTQRAVCALIAYFQEVVQAEPSGKGSTRPSGGG
jgi:hypothetical protein